MWVSADRFCCSYVALCILHPECQRPSQCFIIVAFNPLIEIGAHYSIARRMFHHCSSKLIHNISFDFCGHGRTIKVFALKWTIDYANAE